MKPQTPREMVDSLANLAANAEPPALDDSAARRMIDAAIASPPLRAPVVAPRRSFAWPLATAAFAALALYLFVARRPATEPSPPTTVAEPLRVTLPTGDRLVGTAGAHFDLVELAPASRRLRVTSGEIVFDVAHVAPAQRFEVTTAHATVLATGTVFSVSTDASATRVHVFEGSVSIEHGGRRDALTAGASWSSDAGAASSASILAAGESFAAERTSKPSTAMTVAPPPAPSPRPDPPTTPPTRTPTAPPASTQLPAPALSPAPARTVSTARATTASDPRPSPESPAPIAVASIAEARADIAAGRYDAALAKAASPVRDGESGAWELVRGDALRALRRSSEAATAFESATHALTGTARIEAAYSAAYLALHDLKDGERALADLAGVDEKGSPFEERAMVLRVDALMALGRKNEAAAIAGRYLDRFPTGSSARLMRALLASVK